MKRLYKYNKSVKISFLQLSAKIILSVDELTGFDFLFACVFFFFKVINSPSPSYQADCCAGTATIGAGSYKPVRLCIGGTENKMALKVQ